MRSSIAAAAVAAAVFVSPARAEMPQNRGAPEWTGRAAVGWGVVGHNGTWLYDDGTACGAECMYAFIWERCNIHGCFPIRDAGARVYKVRAVDIGSRLRVVVAATKYDCGEWNYAAGTQECRWVTRFAASAETNVVPRPKPKRPAKPPRRSG